MKDSLNLNILETLYSKFLEIFPKFILFLILIIVGWIIIKIILFAAKGLLKLIKIDSLEEKLNDNELTEKLNIHIKPGKIILGFIKGLLILIFIIIGTEWLGLHAVSQEIGNLISFLPQFFTAVLIFILGIYLANLIKVSIRNLLKSIDVSGSKIISLIVFYFLAVMITITALNQAGINTQIITNNIFLVIGAFLLAFTIAFGLGSKDVVYRLLLGFYTKKNLTLGSKIRIGDIEGIILAIDNISLTIKTNDSKIIYPIKLISNKKIEILD